MNLCRKKWGGGGGGGGEKVKKEKKKIESGENVLMNDCFYSFFLFFSI